MKKGLRKAYGFSMIELMIVVTIVAILAAIAIPSYRQYILRAHRTDATRALQDLASRQESYYFTNNAYASTLDALNSSSSAAGPYFNVTIPSASSTDYVLEADAQGIQAQDAGCQTFKLHRTGQQESTGTASTATCWGGN